MKMKRCRIDLSQDDMPRSWYNILPDLPEKLPGYINAETVEEIKGLPPI
jgi:predicted alternative tryptophan synthase beta-subunit